MSEPMLSGGSIEQVRQTLLQVLLELGQRLGFEVKGEVEASESAWVDVVWFDKRLGLTSLGIDKPKLRRHPMLPVVGFELELRTGLHAKHIKGSVSNLDNLGAAMGIIVIGSDNLKELQKLKGNTGKPLSALEGMLIQRVSRWVYAEAQPKTRIVVMPESEVRRWADWVLNGRPAGAV